MRMLTYKTLHPFTKNNNNNNRNTILKSKNRKNTTTYFWGITGDKIFQKIPMKYFSDPGQSCYGILYIRPALEKRGLMHVCRVEHDKPVLSTYANKGQHFL